MVLVILINSQGGKVMKVISILAAVGFLFTACGEDAKASGLYSAPIFSGNIESAQYDSANDLLEVSLSFGGGCRSHRFELLLSPACLETYPAQCHAEIAHVEGSDDPCEAMLFESVKFPLDSYDQRPSFLTVTSSNGTSAQVYVPVKGFNGSIESVSFDHATDQVVLELSYTGGCMNHRFDLKFSDACLLTAPAKCFAELIQLEGFADRCKAIVKETVRFDLDSIPTRPAELTIGTAVTSVSVLID